MTQKNRRHAPFRVLGCQIPDNQYNTQINDYDNSRRGENYLCIVDKVVTYVTI